MGNAPSGKEAGNIETLIAEFNFVSKKLDPRYGQISLYENKNTKEIVAFKEVVSKSTSDFKKEVELLTARTAQKKEGEPEDPKDRGNLHIVKMLSFATQTYDNLCSSLYRIAIVIEYIERDLETEILEKKTANEIYTEQQIWLLIESLTSALCALHRRNIVLGDLKPMNVLISKDGIYKLADPILVSSHSIPGYTCRLSKLDDARPYLSPELLKNLEEQEFYPRHDAFKSDIFAAGLTILHAASLIDCDDFYNWENNTFSTNALKQRFNSISDIYSEKLLDFLGKMLCYDEGGRFNAFEASEELENIGWREYSMSFRRAPVKTEEAEITYEKHGVNKVEQPHKVHARAEERGNNVAEGRLYESEILRNRVLQKEAPRSKDTEEVDFEEEEEKSRPDDIISAENVVVGHMKPGVSKKLQTGPGMETKEEQKSRAEVDQYIKVEENKEAPPQDNKPETLHEQPLKAEEHKDQTSSQQPEVLKEEPVKAEVSKEEAIKSENIQVKPENIQVKPESIQEQSASIQGKPESVQDQPASIQVKPESVQEKPVMTQEKSGSSIEKPESIHVKPESMQIKPESVQTVKQEKPESVQTVKQEIIQEKPGSSKEVPVNNQEKSESKNVIKESLPRESEGTKKEDSNPRLSVDPAEILNEYRNKYANNIATNSGSYSPTKVDNANGQSKYSSQPGGYKPYSPVSGKYSPTYQPSYVKSANETASNKSSTLYSPVVSSYTPSAYISKYQSAKNGSSPVGATTVQHETTTAIATKSENEKTSLPIKQENSDKAIQENKQNIDSNEQKDTSSAKPAIIKEIKADNGDSSEGYVYRRPPDVDKIIQEIIARPTNPTTTSATNTQSYKPAAQANATSAYSSNYTPHDLKQEDRRSEPISNSQPEATATAHLVNPYKAAEKTEPAGTTSYVLDPTVKAILEEYRIMPQDSARTSEIRKIIIIQKLF